LGARGRPSQSPGPAQASKPAPNEPRLGAAAQILAQAEAAYGAGNTNEASRHLKLLLAMTFDDQRLQARFAELRLKVMRTAAVDFEKQAAYEEKQQHWAQAARSWMRVVDGRPNDSAPLQRVALALLRAGKDLRTAMESAKRAVELAPNEAEAHRTLAKVYVAADMQASARRELEAAQRCSGAEPSEDGTPTGLLKRLLGRDDGE
jgi:tetratricopeptide (TPR) repeat protein